LISHIGNDATFGRAVLGILGIDTIFYDNVAIASDVIPTNVKCQVFFVADLTGEMLLFARLDHASRQQRAECLQANFRK
jgi:hypothetical protein